ncbi:MAG TPA: alpha/beta hydrolase, partial [Firmicutes bacterium]|nr:alpha/beta hydrolase [Bacillota bacterium]
IEQYLFHSGTNNDNPVMLFLHCGPGLAYSPFAHVFQEKWEDLFTVVHWDQRGAGKTLTKNSDQYPTLDLLLKDLLEIIQYLKQKYNQQKIILLGHSWGTVLGSTFIKQYPGEVAYYIGVGQVINMFENERVGYEKVKQEIVKADDKKSLKKLEAIGEYPGKHLDSEFMKKCAQIRKLQEKYDLAIKMGLSVFIAAFQSPIFKWSDFSAMIKGPQASQGLMTALESFDLNDEKDEYQIPIYYILGGKDWLTPFALAREHLGRIRAPRKKFYLIPGAGHATMIDQPELFYQALSEIYHQGKISDASR